MPTTLQRHSITETPEIADAIDRGQHLWPEASRSEVIRRMILRQAETERNELLEARKAANKKWAGFLPNVYPPNAAQMLKEEWPE